MSFLHHFLTSCVQSSSLSYRVAGRILYSPVVLAMALAVALGMLLMNSGTSQAAAPPGAVLEILNENVFDGQSHIEVRHKPEYQIAEGTFSLQFMAKDSGKKQGLFSKDFTGNRDGGDITVFIEHERVKVRLQSEHESFWAESPEGSVKSGKQYHLAVTFGPQGLWIYLNAETMAGKPTYTQGLKENTQNMAIGANTWARTAQKPDATWDHFVGKISNFMLFNRQFGIDHIVRLAGRLAERPPNSPYVRNGWLYGTNDDEQLNADDYNVTKIQGSYGDDVVKGSKDGDILFGGHGEDVIMGRDGDDIINSFGDAREPPIAQNYGNNDDPDDEINDGTRTYYPYQPVEADDILTGGKGADTFYFRTVINAKPHIILKHVRKDGTIEWGMNGVAGENDEVHDHWVEGVGEDVITDFNREEGDHIKIVGHTTEVYKVVHEDTDGDNILDSTALHLWSNQGAGGGAHDKDRLGIIRVFGDMVMEGDYTVEQKDYGILPSITDFPEILTPPVYTSVADDGAPPPYPPVDDGQLPSGAIFGVLKKVDFNGNDHIEVDHMQELQLGEGTFSLRFTADEISGKQGLFSKDFTDTRDGGDITVFLEGGKIKVRLQDEHESYWVDSSHASVSPRQEYHLAVSFGRHGLRLHLNGKLMDELPSFTGGLRNNTQNMAIGANTWARTAQKPYATWDEFSGSISEFMVFDSQLNDGEIALLHNDDQDLAVSLSGVPDKVKVGEQVTYTAEVDNIGGVPFSGVKMKSRLSADVTVDSVTPSRGTCSHSGNTINCDLGDMKAGKKATVEIVVTANQEGRLGNQVGVRTRQTDNNPDNNKAKVWTAIAAP